MITYSLYEPNECSLKVPPAFVPSVTLLLLVPATNVYGTKRPEKKLIYYQ